MYLYILSLMKKQTYLLNKAEKKEIGYYDRPPIKDLRGYAYYYSDGRLFELQFAIFHSPSSFKLKYGWI